MVEKRREEQGDRDVDARAQYAMHPPLFCQPLCKQTDTGIAHVICPAFHFNTSPIPILSLTHRSSSLSNPITTTISIVASCDREYRSTFKTHEGRRGEVEESWRRRAGEQRGDEDEDRYMVSFPLLQPEPERANDQQYSVDSHDILSLGLGIQTKPVLGGCDMRRLRSS
jgi:hypothetical protein